MPSGSCAVYWIPSSVAPAAAAARRCVPPPPPAAAALPARFRRPGRRGPAALLVAGGLVRLPLAAATVAAAAAAASPAAGPTWWWPAGCVFCFGGPHVVRCWTPAPSAAAFAPAQLLAAPFAPRPVHATDMETRFDAQVEGTRRVDLESQGGRETARAAGSQGWKGGRPLSPAPLSQNGRPQATKGSFAPRGVAAFAPRSPAAPPPPSLRLPHHPLLPCAGRRRRRPAETAGRLRVRPLSELGCAAGKHLYALAAAPPPRPGQRSRGGRSGAIPRSPHAAAAAAAAPASFFSANSRGGVEARSGIDHGA
ncbi:Protein of unknown function [Gryllus bimaculatus]|nr:Protein of unknown function [Gryllus bimaculatus]